MLATVTREANVPAPSNEPAWVTVCRVDDILPWTGVCALVAGRPVAVVRAGEGTTLHALDNFDPFSKASVLSRGIVGDRNGVAVIASPIYKQRFALGTGECLDDPNVRLTVYDVRVRDGWVEVASPGMNGAVGR